MSGEDRETEGKSRNFLGLLEDILFGEKRGQILWQPRIGCWYNDKVFAGEEQVIETPVGSISCVIQGNSSNGGRFPSKLVYLPRVNIQYLYIDLMGVEQTVFALADYPEDLEHFFEVLRKNQDQLIDVVNASPKPQGAQVRECIELFAPQADSWYFG